MFTSCINKTKFADFLFDFFIKAIRFSRILELISLANGADAAVKVRGAERRSSGTRVHQNLRLSSAEGSEQSWERLQSSELIALINRPVIKTRSPRKHKHAGTVAFKHGARLYGSTQLCHFYCVCHSPHYLCGGGCVCVCVCS